MFRYSSAARAETTIRVHRRVNGIDPPAVRGDETTVRRGRGTAEDRGPRTGRTAGA
ncbi:hypothetical protein GCM10009625_13240 [Brachybacterium fresconis]